MTALWMWKFIFFEVLCYAESEADSSLKINISNKHERRAQKWFFLCAIHGWQHVLWSLECTQEAAGYLSLSDHMGICRSPQKDGLYIYIGLFSRLNCKSARIIKICVARESNDRCWQNYANNFWRGVPWPTQCMFSPSIKKILDEAHLQVWETEIGNNRYC